MFEPEPLPGAGESGLDLVDHHQRTGLVADLPDALEVLGGRRMDAAFAQDRLDQDRCNGAVDSLTHRIEVAPGDVTEPIGHGGERLVLRRLTGGGERGEGSAVKTAEGAHDRVSTPTPVFARQLDGALVRLGTGVREEDLSPVSGRFEEQFVDLDRSLGGDWVGEEVRHVQKSLELVADRLGDDHVRVAERHDRDAGEEVEIALAVGIPELGALATLEHDRGWPEHRHEGAVGHRCVVECV